MPRNASKKPFKEDLPAVRAKALVASGAIVRGMRLLSVEVSGACFDVALTLSALPDGGFFAWLICPQCNRLATVLRLLDERLLCRRCDGLPYATQARRSRDIGRLIELLAKPRIRNRARLQLTLQRALLKQKKQAFHHAEKGLAQPDQDPG